MLMCLLQTHHENACAQLLERIGTTKMCVLYIVTTILLVCAQHASELRDARRAHIHAQGQPLSDKR